MTVYKGEITYMPSSIKLYLPKPDAYLIKDLYSDSFSIEKDGKFMKCNSPVTHRNLNIILEFSIKYLFREHLGKCSLCRQHYRHCFNCYDPGVRFITEDVMTFDDNVLNACNIVTKFTLIPNPDKRVAGSSSKVMSILDSIK